MSFRQCFELLFINREARQAEPLVCVAQNKVCIGQFREAEGAASPHGIFIMFLLEIVIFFIFQRETRRAGFREWTVQMWVFVQQFREG